MAGEDIVAVARLNATEFFGSLRQMNSEINSNTREWKAQFSALSRSGDWVGAYKAKVEGLNKVYQTQQEKIKSLRSQMDAIGTPKTEKDVAELKNLGNQLKTAESQVKLFDVQIKNSNLALKRAETGIHELANEHKILSQITKANSEVFEKQGLQYTANREKALGLIAETRNLNKQYQAQDQILGSLKSAYNAYSDEQKQSDTYAKQLARDIKEQETVMTQTASAIKNNQTEYSSLGKNITNVGQVTTLTADHIKNMGSKLVTSGQSLQQFGFFSQTASAGLLSMFKQGMEGSAKLDQSLRETYNMLDKKPAGGMNSFLKEYRSEIANLSKQWGVSQNDIADGMQEVIRAGYDQKSALEIATSSMQTSMATGEDYGEIMSGTTQIMSQFGLKTDDASKNMENASRVQNALAKVANDTQTSYVGLSEAMSKVGPVAANMGYTVEQTASLIGYMANKGIDAEQAGNNLRMVFQRLSAPTAQAGDALKELGVSATDAHGNMKKLPEIMDQIDDATKNMGSAQRQEYIKKIFGAYATTAATALLDGRSAIEKESNAAGQAVADGYTKGLAKSNIKGADAQIKIFKAQWQALTMEFANDIMPTLTDVMKTAGDLFKEFDKLSPSTKKMVAEFVAFGAVASPLAITLGSAATVAGTLFKVFGAGVPKIVGLANSFLKIKQATTVAKDIEGVAGATTRVAKFAGLAGGSLGTLGEGAGVAALGISGTALAVTGVGAALAVAGVAAYAYVKHQQKMAEAAKTTAEREKTYGYDVSKAVSDKLDVIKNHSFDTQYALQQLGDAKIDTGEIDNAKKAMDDFSDSVENAFEKKNKGIDSKIKEIQELIGKTSGQTKQALENELAWLTGSKENNQQYIDELEKNKTKQDDIFKQIADQGGKATKEQIKQLEEINKATVNSAIDSIKGLKEPVKKAIKDALDNKDVTKESLTTLKQGFKEYNKIIGDSLSDQIKVTQESAKIVGKNTAWGDFFKDNAAALKPAADMMSAALQKVNKDTLTGLPNQKEYSSTIDSLKKSVEAAGINWDQYRKHMGIATADQIMSMTSMISTLYTWNQQPVDVKKAEFKTTGLEELTGGLVTFNEFDKMSDSEKRATIKAAGNQELMALITTGSDFDERAPEAVKQAVLKAIGQGNVKDAISIAKNFDKLPTGVKTFVSKAKGQKEVQNASKMVEEWNKLPQKQKTALAKASGEDQVNFLTSRIKNWNSLPQKVKTAVGKQLGQGDVKGATDTLDNWNRRVMKAKQARSSESGSGSVNSASRSLDNFNSKNPRTKTATSRQIGKVAVDNAVASFGNFIGLPSVVTRTAEYVTKHITKWIDDFTGKGRASGGTVTDNETETWLGDGGKNEPYVTPSGFMGVSGNDWELHSLEPGTIVYPSISAYTQMTGNQINPDMIPAFAGGGTVPYTGQLQAVDYINSEVKNKQSEVILSGNSNSNADVVNELKNAVNLLGKLISVQQDKTNINVVLSKDELYKQQAIDVGLRNIQSLT